MPHKKPIASETDARKMQSFARLGGLKEAPASIGGEYFTFYDIIKKKIILEVKFWIQNLLYSTIFRKTVNVFCLIIYHAYLHI